MVRYAAEEFQIIETIAVEDIFVTRIASMENVCGNVRVVFCAPETIVEGKVIHSVRAKLIIPAQLITEIGVYVCGHSEGVRIAAPGSPVCSVKKH